MQHRCLLAIGLYCLHRGRRRRYGLSDAPGAADRRLSARRQHGHRGAHDRPAPGPGIHHTVVIDNRRARAGTIGAGIVVKADPDGHTLSFAASPEVAIYRALMKNPPYDR